MIAPLINPNDVEDFNRTILEKEAFFFFTIFVAGKTAKTIAPKAQSFHQDLINLLLFRLTEEQVIENGIIKLIDFLSINDVMEVLYTNKVGKYSVLKKLFIELKKTSRYFMLYTFKDAGDIAILDRHVLTFLKQKGYEVPDNTPSGKQYDNIEKIFLKEFEKSGYKSLTEFDLDIWKAKGNI